MLFDENAESQLKNDNSKEKKDKRSNKSIYKGGLNLDLIVVKNIIDLVYYSTLCSFSMWEKI